MKIAFCSKGNFSLEKGFTKNRIELAESLTQLGWETVLVDKKMLGIPGKEKYNAIRHSRALKEYLIENDWEFDVVLYEYDTLPFERKLFNPKTLFVARPAILAFHFDNIKLKYDLKTKLANLKQQIKHRLIRSKKAGHPDELDRITKSMSNADLIQVQNEKDRRLLIAKGYSKDKIIVVPNGIARDRILQFEKIFRSYSPPYKVAFVGTFDYRKGAMDFPKIFKRIQKYLPGTKLKLLGTKGIFQSKKEVLGFFPKRFHQYIEVVPSFSSANLPNLLEDCHVGMFPSYLESFGFGALEMMAAGLPVISYDAPGPSDFIDPEFLVPTGDHTEMADKIIRLLSNEAMLRKKASAIKSKVFDNYCWDDIACAVDLKYRKFLKDLRTGYTEREKNSKDFEFPEKIETL